MSETTTAERFPSFEYRWANHAARLLPEAERERYFSFHHITRLLASPDSAFVVFCVKDGRPEVIDTIRLADVQAALAGGLQLTFERARGQRFTIGQKPSRPEGLDVFFWVSGVSEVRWTPVNWRDSGGPRKLGVTFHINTARGLNDPLVEGAHYISTAKKFAEHYNTNEETV
jgi:hypothetical protein